LKPWLQDCLNELSESSQSSTDPQERSVTGQMKDRRLSVFSAGQQLAVEECFIRFSSIFLHQWLL
jgi:hypothetical protein